MVDILVRNVGEEVARSLKEKAAASGKSVNETAREALRRFVQPSRQDAWAEADRIRSTSAPSDVDSTDLIRADRANDEPYR